MSPLTTWFIFELIGMGAAPDLREPQAFKSVALKMMIGQTIIFRGIVFKKLHLVQVLMFDVQGQSGNGSNTHLPLQLPLPQKFIASAYRFLVIPKYIFVTGCSCRVALFLKRKRGIKVREPHFFLNFSD